MEVQYIISEFGPNFFSDNFLRKKRTSLNFSNNNSCKSVKFITEMIFRWLSPQHKNATTFLLLGWSSPFLPIHPNPFPFPLGKIQSSFQFSHHTYCLLKSEAHEGGFIISEFALPIPQEHPLSSKIFCRCLSFSSSSSSSACFNISASRFSFAVCCFSSVTLSSLSGSWSSSGPWHINIKSRVDYLQILFCCSCELVPNSQHKPGLFSETWYNGVGLRIMLVIKIVRHYHSAVIFLQRLKSFQWNIDPSSRN